MLISSSMPHLDIKTTNAKVEIQNEPLRLVVEREPARMHVRRTRPQMKVDWRKIRNESGLRSPAAQRKHLQQLYRQLALSGTSRMSQMYDDISSIEGVTSGGPEIVATVTLHAVLNDNIPVVNVANIPSSMPEVEWQEGKLEIEWEPAKLEMRWEGDARPKITVTPHTVEIRLTNGATIRVGESNAIALEKQGQGRRVDKRV